MEAETNILLFVKQNRNTSQNLNINVKHFKLARQTKLPQTVELTNLKSNNNTSKFKIMKKLILPTALFTAASVLSATAATPTAGEEQTVPVARAEISVKALQEMQKSINDDAPIFETLDLSTGWLEDLPPDEQFRDIADAINTKLSDDNARRNAISEIFGSEYTDTMSATLADPAKTQKVETLLGDAHQLFSDYENRNDVADWGWGDAWGVTITPNIGTLGLGIQAGYEFNKYFKIRAHYATGKLDANLEFTDTNIDLEWKNRDNMGLFFDWHPRASQFHITAGVIKMDPRIKASAQYRGTTKASDSTGKPATYEVISDYNMTGNWENDYCPYLGIGWSTDGGQKRTLYFSIDLGLAYLGEGNYTESGRPHFKKNGQDFINPEDTGDFSHLGEVDAVKTLLDFDANVRDVVQELADFLNDMYVYPVVQFGGGIRF